MQWLLGLRRNCNFTKQAIELRREAERELNRGKYANTLVVPGYDSRRDGRLRLGEGVECFYRNTFRKHDR